MSTRRMDSSSAGTDRALHEPSAYPELTANEQHDGSHLSVLPHSVLDDNCAVSSVKININTSESTCTRAVASVVQAEVNTVSSSDCASLNTFLATCQTDNGDRLSLSGLQRSASSRRGSQTSLFPSSPRLRSSGSRRSVSRSSRRNGTEDRVRRGDMLMELVRSDSIRSRESRRSARDSAKDRHTSSRCRNESGTSTPSSSCSSISHRSGVNAAFTKDGRRGYMTAKEAVLRGETVCGCFLKVRLLYFYKPVIFLFFGSILIAGGIALTILHFMYEDVVGEPGGPSPSTNVPYFTWGPITLSTGVIIFMIGLVWVPIKEQKWKDGKASPMLAALEQWHAENAKKGSIEMRSFSIAQSSAGAEKTMETIIDMAGETQTADMRNFAESKSSHLDFRSRNEDIV